MTNFIGTKTNKRKNRDGNDHDDNGDEWQNKNSKTIIKTTTKWITTRATNNNRIPSSSSSSSTFNQSLSRIICKIRTTLESSFVLFCRCHHIECGIHIYICVCECVVICVHFPRFYGKPRCVLYTHTYIYCTVMVVSSFFACFHSPPSLSPSHLASNISLSHSFAYSVLSLHHFVILAHFPVFHAIHLIVSLHILYCIRVYIVRYMLCAHSHHSTYYYCIYCIFNHVFICRFYLFVLFFLLFLL